MHENLQAGMQSVRSQTEMPDQLSTLDLDAFMQTRFNPQRNDPKSERNCVHWPFGGAQKIQAASRALLVLADIWARAEAISKSVPYHQVGCIDMQAIGNNPDADLLLLCAATVPAEIQQIKLSTCALADDFEKVGGWLAEAVPSTWDAAKAVRSSRPLAAVLSEENRVVAKDRLAADMNILIAWLLRQAVRTLNRIELTTAAVESDLMGLRCYEAFLQAGAEMLDRAGALAIESMAVVQEFDRRWRAFQHQIATVVALSRDAGGPLGMAQQP